MFKKIDKKKIKENLKRRHQNNIKIIIAAVAIVFFRRWVWDLIDIYLLPIYPVLSAIISVLIWIVLLYTSDGALKGLK